MIPIEYATAPRERQREIAQAITDLRLLRFLTDLDNASSDERHGAVIERVAELRQLERPFRAPNDIGDELRPMPFEIGLADFLRQFDGEPALLGDICLVQGDVRFATALLQPIVDLPGIEYHRRTNWLSKVRTVELGEFGSAESGIRSFHQDVAARCRDLVGASSSDNETEDAAAGDWLLHTIVALCEERTGWFVPEARDRGRYLPEGGGQRLTNLGGVAVPIDGLASMTGALRTLRDRALRLMRRRPEEGEGEGQGPVAIG